MSFLFGPTRTETIGAALLSMLRASTSARVLVASSAMALAEANERMPKMAAIVANDFILIVSVMEKCRCFRLGMTERKCCKKMMPCLL